MTDRYIVIDEEGLFAFDGRRVDDESMGRTLIENLEFDDTNTVRTSMQGNPAFVEYFDAPLLVKHVHLDGSLDLLYGARARFDFANLSLDEWDRFHGVTDKKVPFVLSRQAQFEFFDLLESFDDDSITVKGQRFAIPPWLESSDAGEKSEFWTTIYRTEQPGWELGQESVVLKDILPQLKMPKARILVLGCGSGHDAAFFARAGHVVTGVDFSEEALARAQASYGEIDNLKFVRSDIFALPEKWTGQFDVVFEHTCYCAVKPERRNELVRVWRRVLQPQGHLLGVFFAFERRRGPPWGGSEWEVRERLKGGFDFLYWTRWRKSIDKRRGKEIVVYARKRT